jgi:hypothetical protein
MDRPRVVLIAVLAASAGAAGGALVASSRAPSIRLPEPASRTIPLSPFMPDGSLIVRDPARSLRVVVAPGWRVVREDLTPRLARSERDVLAVATFDPSARPRRGCGPLPGMPQTPIGPRDSLLHVLEELDAQPGRLPRREVRVRLRKQLRVPEPDEPVRSVFPWRCLNRPGIAGLRTSFRVHGRLMHVTAVAGEGTSTRRRRELLGMVRNLRFLPPRPVIVNVIPAAPGPLTRVRLGLISTLRTGRRGRRVREYWASVRGPLKTACVIENEAWFSRGPAGDTLHATLDPRRTKGNRWCRGRFHGIVRYRDAICRSAECERVYIRRAGRFGFTVR